MFKLAGASALLLCACTTFVSDEGPFSTELTWSLESPESGCQEPTDVQWGWIEEGFLLWTEHWGVTFTEVERPRDDSSLYFSLCPTPTLPRPGYGGWAEMWGGRGRISFYTGPSERYFIATVAHEAGHLILHGEAEDHLAEPLLGIMSSGIDCDQDRCVWSDEDIAHIGSFGLTYTP